MKPSKFESEFNSTRTNLSHFFHRQKAADDSVNVWLYQANDVGYEYNKAGYYHKREGGICYLLAYTKSGKANLTYEGLSYTLNPGSLAFINLEGRSVVDARTSDWEIYFIHVLGSQAGDFYQSFTKSQGHVLDNFDSSNFVSYIDEIYYSYLEKKDKNYISGLIYLLLLDVLDKAEKQGLYSELVNKAIEILNSQYASDISVDELCDELHISKYYFIRKFDKEVGMTPKKYLTNIRLEKARVMLASTSKTVQEIALLTGFKNEENIYYAFKKELNVSPDYFRKNIYSKNIIQAK